MVSQLNWYSVGCGASFIHPNRKSVNAKEKRQHYNFLETLHLTLALNNKIKFPRRRRYLAWQAIIAKRIPCRRGKKASKCMGTGRE